MKKAILLIVAAVSIFAFAGCAAGYDSTTGYNGYGYDGYYDGYNNYNGYGTRSNNYYNGYGTGYNTTTPNY